MIIDRAQSRELILPSLSSHPRASSSSICVSAEVDKNIATILSFLSFFLLHASRDQFSTLFRKNTSAKIAQKMQKIDLDRVALGDA